MLVTRAKLGRISIHCLRHTHVTELLRAGVHPKVVSERVGHSSVAFTLQRYGHALPDMQQNAADQMQRLVGHLVRRNSVARRPVPIRCQFAFSMVGDC